MDKRNFEHCCGVVEIGFFFPVEKRSNIKNDEELRELEQGARDDMKGAVICTTNFWQRRTQLMLKRNGYINIVTFLNPNTDHEVKVWFKDIWEV